MYIYDPTTATNHVMNNPRRNSDPLDSRFVRILQDEMHRHHPAVHKFKQAMEITQNIPPEFDCTISLRFSKDCDRRRYNLPSPSSDEIAVIIPGEGNETTEPKDVILRLRGGGLRRVSDMNRLFHSLHFVLLFPTGQLGWHPGLLMSLPANNEDTENSVGGDDFGGEDPTQEENTNDLEPAADTVHVSRKTMSQAEFFKYRLHIRNNQTKHLFLAGHLFQEFVVDSWALVEQSRLFWVRKNQSTLCSDVYRGFVDTVTQNPEADANQLGQRIILPSSFSGSTRSMIQLCQNALAIGRHFGSGDLFPTATCNPQWPEILQELSPGQKSSDRPDLIVRVFRLKMHELLHEIFHNHVLGKPVAKVYTIEFQKRGLPNMHMIIFLDAASKLRTPEDVDSLISAEFPDPNVDPELHDLVMKFMVHGPCGSLNPNSPCMENRKCTKHFPKNSRVPPLSMRTLTLLIG